MDELWTYDFEDERRRGFCSTSKVRAADEAMRSKGMRTTWGRRLLSMTSSPRSDCVESKSIGTRGQAVPSLTTTVSLSNLIQFPL